MFYNEVERSKTMDKDLLEAIELFKKADDKTKASVVDLLKSVTQQGDSQQMYSERVE